MNMQEAFDTAARQIIKQGGQCIGGESDACQYRGPNGTKCAAGAVMPDEFYRPEMEGKPIDDLVDECGFVLPDWMQEDVMMLLLSRLQVTHDISLAENNWHLWQLKMQEIARDFKLDASAVANVPGR
jgi:hypothetical protein